MKTILLVTLLSFASVANLAAQSSSLLAWTSNDNRTIEARFIGVGPQSVLIEKDGVVFHVAFARLSPRSIAQARSLGGRISQKQSAPNSPSILATTHAGQETHKLPRNPLPTREQQTLPAGLRRLPSQPEWRFLHAYQLGEDIVVHQAIATVFGHDTQLGVYDPNDNGLCASGRGTQANPGILGCALPVSLAHRSTVGSPFALLSGLSWFSQVVVTYKGRSITVQLIDNGPSAPISGDTVPAGIDLTPAACHALGIPLEDIRSNRVSFPVSFRVLGAGRRLLASN